MWGFLISAAGGTLLRGALTAGFALSVASGILRVITLLGIGVATYQSIDTMLPYFMTAVNQASGYSSGQSAAFNALGEVFGLLKVQEALSLIIGAIGQRLTYRLAFLVTRGTGQGY